VKLRILITATLVLVLVLTACAGQPQATPTQQPTKPAAEATKPAPAPTAPAAQATKPSAQATKPAEPAAKATEPAKPASQPAAANAAVEAFYKGKTITVIVGNSAGGGYDLYTRLLARHMGKHIPGNPTLIVQNMPGAGSLVATNHLYNAAAKDGTVFGSVDRGIPGEQLIGTEGVQYDANKFNWIGSMNEEVSVCVARADSPVKTFDEMFSKPLKIGGTGPGADTDMFPNFLNAVLGTKFDLVSGYPGGNDINLAMERNEVQGRCGWSWSSVKSTRPDWVKNGFINILVQMALHKHPDLPNVPLIMDYAKDEKTKNMMEVVFARQTMGRPLVAPPGVPPERIEALRKAFVDTMNDPDLKAEAEKSQQELSVISGDDIQKLVARILQTPKDQVDILAKYMAAERSK